MAERCVAHLDMDAFYVSVELRRRPELRGRPVIVAGTGPRAVVTTASYEARRFGVGSAMPASRARRLCPDGVYLTPDFAYYREASSEGMAIVRAHVETIEVIGLDEAYLELTGLPAPHAAMRRILLEIETTTGLSGSVGIGPSKLVAKVASDAEKPAGFVVLSREQACARFASSPPGLVPGIGPKTSARLAELGLTTLAAVAAAPWRRASPSRPRSGAPRSWRSSRPRAGRCPPPPPACRAARDGVAARSTRRRRPRRGGRRSARTTRRTLSSESSVPSGGRESAYGRR